MAFKHWRKVVWLLAMGVGALGLGIVSLGGSLTTPVLALAPAPAEVVQTAWRNLAVAEAYRFSTSLEQIIWPAPRLANTGRSRQRGNDGMMDLPPHTATPARAGVHAGESRRAACRRGCTAGG